MFTRDRAERTAPLPTCIDAIKAASNVISALPDAQEDLRHALREAEPVRARLDTGATGQVEREWLLRLSQTGKPCNSWPQPTGKLQTVLCAALKLRVFEAALWSIQSTTLKQQERHTYL